MPLLFRDTTEQRAYMVKYLRTFYPTFETGGDIYRGFLNRYLTGKIVLDAGCGDGGIITEFKNLPAELIGVDTNKPLLDSNSTVTKKILANVEQIPLHDNSIDVIVSEFVFEHLESPEKVFKEFHRVMRSGAKVIFLTPNVLNPVMLASKIMPHAAHTFFRSRVLRKGEETHKTFYRANTVGIIQQHAREAGLTLVEYQRAGNPEYIGFAKPLVIPVIIGERAINNPALSFLKMYIAGVLTK